MSSLLFPTPDALFGAANGLAMLGWIALAVSPAHARWAGSARLFAGRVIPVFLALWYVALFARNGMADGNFSSLQGVARLFAVPELLTAGWLHYLAFDLFVGSWIAERSSALGLPHWLLLPLLVLTFLFGPAGLLVFLMLQAVVTGWRRRATDTTSSVSARTPIGSLVAELLQRERRLAIFGFLVLALLIPATVAWGLDERTLRGANVWLKPMKFLLSVGLFALTTAWLVGHLQAGARHLRAVTVMVWVLIGSGTFELVYITVQAALGQGSHYNIGDIFHSVMYALMGIGAMSLTATQVVLAWLLIRHGDPQRPAAYRLAVIIGLVMTFVLGASVGALLSVPMFKPPEIAVLPVVGWSMAGGDLRPSHFLGIHAQQVLPLVGFAVAGWGEVTSRRTVWAVTTAYVLLFVAALVWGLAGRL